MNHTSKKNKQKLRKKPSRQIKPKMVRNPLTSRFIKVGGKTWSALVRDGHIRTGNYQHPNTLLQIDEDDFSSDESQIRHLELEKAKYNRSVGDEAGVRAVRRGKTKLIKQRSKLTNRTTAEKTAEAGAVVIERIDSGEIVVPNNLTRKKRKRWLEDLIQDQLVSKKKSVPKLSQFQIVPESSESEESSSDDYEYYEK